MVATALTLTLWHQRLGHPRRRSLQKTLPNLDFTTTKENSHICESYQLGKHVRLPFSSSVSVSYVPFQIIHADVWTAPVQSFSGFKYYLVFIDDYSHYIWTFPLRAKSDVFHYFLAFHAYVSTQFQLPLISLQTDNGREFDNHALCSYLSTHGIALRLSCPYTSPQNGKAERTLRTLNDCTRTLLLHAGMPGPYWVEALNTATHIVNRRPCHTTGNATPFQFLFGTTPSYSQLRTFGCLCFPNQAATAPHKLAARSTPCALLGYSTDHRGYRCLDLHSRRVITSRHVIFDESQFPFLSDKFPTTVTTPGRATISELPDSPVIIQQFPAPPPISPTTPSASTPSASTPSNHTQSVSSPADITPDTPSASHTPLNGNTPDRSPSAAPPVIPQAAPHPMVTRSRVGTVKPNPKYALVTTNSTNPSPSLLSPKLSARP